MDLLDELMEPLLAPKCDETPQRGPLAFIAPTWWATDRHMLMQMRSLHRDGMRVYIVGDLHARAVRWVPDDDPGEVEYLSWFKA